VLKPKRTTTAMIEQPPATQTEAPKHEAIVQTLPFGELGLGYAGDYFRASRGRAAYCLS